MTLKCLKLKRAEQRKFVEKRRNSRIGGKDHDIGQWPGNAGTDKDEGTNGAPDNCTKWCVVHGAQDQNWRHGGCASGSFSVLANWGADPKLWHNKNGRHAPRLGARHGRKTRDVSRRRILKPDPDSRETKIRARGDARNLRTRKNRPLCIEAMLSTAVHHS